MTAADRLQDIVQRLSEDSALLVRTEIDLAKAEVREKVMSLAKAAAMGAVAAALALVALFALVQALIDGIAVFTPDWLAALIVGVLLILGAGLFGLLALRNG